jgi:hypothetical protein
MNVDSFEPPDFSGCSRECGRVAWTVELDVIDEWGGDSMEGRIKPPEVGEESIDVWVWLWNSVEVLLY